MTRKSASLAALLSFVFPGLGHEYLGRRRAALVFALPAVIALVALGLEALTGLDSVLAFVITPSGAMTILALVVLTGLWRLIAMVDAVLVVRRRSGLRRPAVAATGILLAVVLATHGAMAYMAYSVYDASARIFVDSGPDGTIASTAPSGSAPAGSDDPGNQFQATPLATPENANSRINILLTGIDSAPGRDHALTDTLLVVSVNPVDKSVVMLSLPRDISSFPLYDGRTFTGKINSLMSWAGSHPSDFPLGAFPTLIKEVGYLIGVPIHYYAAIDLDGFRRMIDEVGGVTVDNPKVINDPKYDWLDGTHGFYLKAGTVTLNGRTALAYVRSRQGVGDSDFTRAARQQQLLVALRAKLAAPDMIPRLPAILGVAGDTVRTNLPTDNLEQFIGLARSVDTSTIKRYVLGPPISLHPPDSTTGGVYTLSLQMDRMAKLSVQLFGSDSRYANP